jgi:hypothetical protein
MATTLLKGDLGAPLRQRGGGSQREQSRPCDPVLKLDDQARHEVSD